MRSSSIFGGAKVPRVLVNGASVAGSTPIALGGQGFARRVNTGALTANTLVTALSLTGSGVVGYFSAVSVDATSRTHRVKITIDGTVAFDATSAAATTGGDGVIAIGTLGSSSYPVLDQIPYNTSFLVEYASSVAETAKTQFAYIYRTN